MTRVAYINASAGVAGDMLLGALIDAGADIEAVGSTLAGLGVDGWALTFERVQRGGIAATWANVVTDTPHDHDHGDHHPHRPARVITELLAAADLPDPVRATAQRIFDTLAAAEGEVHGIDPADVEFHEVGALDAIVDVVGVAAALHSLGIDRIVAAPIGMGHGTTRSAHGVLPNPPPAVARLLAQRAVPVVGVDTPMELATPTGVAILVAMADSFGPLPSMTVEGTGYGAGTADPGRPPERRAGARRLGGRGVERRRRRAVPSSRSSPTSTTSQARCSPTPSRHCSPPAPSTRGRRRS